MYNTAKNKIKRPLVAHMHAGESYPYFMYENLFESFTDKKSSFDNIPSMQTDI